MQVETVFLMLLCSSSIYPNGYILMQFLLDVEENPQTLIYVTLKWLFNLAVPTISSEVSFNYLWSYQLFPFPRVSSVYSLK